LIKNIRNIIFDLGGVLLNIDHQNTINAFQKLGVKDFSQVFSKTTQNTLMQDFERGALTEALFRKHLTDRIGSEIDHTLIDLAWNAMLLDFPESRFRLLLKLKSQYQLYLLSNTNSIHYSAFQELICKTYPIQLLDDLFNKAYYSHLIGMRKPDAEIFQFVLQDQAILPEETLFIDDSPQHIDAAKLLNIQTHHLLDNEEVSIILTNILA
jgi:putative hydrolase of the HAD superfamily